MNIFYPGLSLMVLGLIVAIVIFISLIASSITIKEQKTVDGKTTTTSVFCEQRECRYNLVYTCKKKAVIMPVKCESFRDELLGGRDD